MKRRSNHVAPKTKRALLIFLTVGLVDMQMKEFRVSKQHLPIYSF